MNFVSCARSITSGVGVQAIGWFSRTLVSCILINNFTAETRETQRKQISFGTDFATLRVRRNNRVSRKARKGRKEEMDQNVVDISLPNGLFIGKVAIVTGASRGVGRATAVRLAEGGANVVVNYLSRHVEADEVVAECKGKGVDAVAVQADTSEFLQAQELAKKTIERFGGVDLLV